jgi:glycosyltransferase involved in cell wall biosynthesis
VHVGRFSYAKNHAMLLEAFATIRKHRRVKLMLIGDGEDEASVRARCTSLGLDADVIFIGFTRNPYKYLARAAVSVLTSRFEGLPNVVIESLALGVPVVSTACEFGPGEILGDSEYGVLTPVGDPAAFAAAVEALLDDPVRRRRLSELGPARARDFDLQRIAPAYEDLLTRTAGLRPARQSVAS